MEDQVFTIQVRCFFCMSDQFELPFEDYLPYHGELVRCANCGRDNDWTSQTRVIDKEIEEITDVIRSMVADELRSTLKRAFSGSSFVSIK